MSAADFAMTVAVGSLFASTISTASPPLSIGIVALASLYAGQWILAYLRRKSKYFSKIVDNPPVVLMAGQNVFDDNLAKTNVTRADLYGKLREANALNFNEVLAVVFETTGDISVLHSSDPASRLAAELLLNVEGGDLVERVLKQ